MNFTLTVQPETARQLRTHSVTTVDGLVKAVQEALDEANARGDQTTWAAIAQHSAKAVKAIRNGKRTEARKHLHLALGAAFGPGMGMS